MAVRNSNEFLMRQKIPVAKSKKICGKYPIACYRDSKFLGIFFIMKSSRKSEVLYRKGKPSKSGCAWFNNIREAINYDGDTDDEEIYYLVIYPNEYDNFRENGVGFVLKEKCRDMWECLESRVKPAPPCLAGLLQQ